MRIAGRYLRTVRHLRPAQVFWRARYMLRRRLGWHPRPPLPAAAPLLDPGILDRIEAHVRLMARHAPPQMQALEALRAGCFSFLQETRACGASGTPPWRAPDASRLWQYHLHYFEFARAFALAHAADMSAPDDGARLLAWMHDWIQRNPPGTDVAWDAFPLSMRLQHWLMAESVFRFNDALVLRSIHQQTAYFRRSLEYDNRGNHLFKNAAALWVAALALGGAGQETAALLLKQETREQILDDGGHEERSPMYHALVLEDVLMAQAVCGAPWLDDAARRMAAFLETMLHPDGEIPLFNDAALHGSLPPRALIAIAAAQAGDDAQPHRPEASADTAAYSGCLALPSSGFYLLGPRDGAARMIVKTGPPGPEHQPAHAHADLLTFEFSIGKQRLVVDSGVHGYAGSPWREYCRSTRAHNTVCIGNCDQMEMWGVFRVGRRARTQIIEWRVTEESAVLRARHDGYRPALHARCFLYGREGCWGVADRVSGNSGPVVSYLHFHPDAALEESGDCWRVRAGSAHCRVYFFGIASAQCVQGANNPCQGWYCPEFGTALPAPVLALKPAHPAQSAFGYVIVPDKPDEEPARPPELFIDRLKQCAATLI